MSVSFIHVPHAVYILYWLKLTVHLWKSSVPLWASA